jgi:hypothetical protein
MGKILETPRRKSSRYLGMLTLSPDSWIVLAAVSQLERELIVERVKCGLAAAKARGKQIGRKKLRNSMLIRQLLKNGLSFRQVAKIAGVSHGSISAEKKDMLRDEALERKRLEENLKESAAEQKVKIDGNMPSIPDASPTSLT